MEKVKPEVLKEEYIIKDLLAREDYLFSSSGDRNMTLLIGSVFFAALTLVLMISGILPWHCSIFSIGFAIVAVTCGYRVARDCIEHKNKKKAILAGEFHIAREKLTNVGYETVYEPHIHSSFGRVHTHHTREALFLYFPVGEWRVPRTTLYKWSETYYLSPTGLYNTSLAGEEFFVVTLNYDHTIGCAYNTKFFKYVKV